MRSPNWKAFIGCEGRVLAEIGARPLEGQRVPVAPLRSVDTGGSVALWRGNAKMKLHTMPATRYNGRLELTFIQVCWDAFFPEDLALWDLDTYLAIAIGLWS